MEKLKVIFIDEVHPILQEALEEMGFECHIKTMLNRVQIEEIIHEYTGAVIRSKFLFDKKIIDKAGKLKFIARSGSGLENIDTAHAASKNIKCYNSPEGNANAVGEHCLGMLLTLFRKVCSADAEVRQGSWKREENRGIELDGKTVGLIGYGNTGKAFAKKLRGFDVEILAYDKYLSNYSDQWVIQSSLEEIQQKAEIISLHVPYTAETHHLISDSFIQSCKRDFYLINTSRGKCVNTKDLVKNLQNSKLRGACLDVLEFESTSFENLSEGEFPEAFNYLRTSKNTLLSPHIAGWTSESYVKLSAVLGEKIGKGFRNM